MSLDEIVEKMKDNKDIAIPIIDKEEEDVIVVQKEEAKKQGAN